MKSCRFLISSVVLAVAGLGPAVAADAAPAVRPDPAKGRTLAAPCLACHLADGARGLPANPILQGQHPDYLVKQLVEFKTVKRKNAIMNGMAAPLSEQDMQHIAAFYGTQRPLEGAARNRDTLAIGEAIYRGGILAKQVPACAGCHSPTGAGIPAQYPRVGGQHGEYLEAQLLLFRSGERANSAQMTTIASKMNDLEIKAVADYMAGLR